MRKLRAFTLAEMMVAFLFVTIALFAYIGLQLRLLHSSARLDWKEEAWLTLQKEYLLFTAEARIRDVGEVHFQKFADHAMRSGRRDWDKRVDVLPVPNLPGASQVQGSLDVGSEHGRLHYVYATYSRRYKQNRWP